MGNRGKFIVIEGLDGSGKTVQSKKLRDCFEENGIPVYLTAECSSGPIGKVIRNEYLSGKRTGDPRICNLLYAVDRLDHITNDEDGMLKILDQGINVICDRYYHSSFAYYSQMYLGTDEYESQMRFIMAQNLINAELLTPDITVFIEMTAIDAAKRLSNRNSTTEIYERADIQEKIRTAYYDAFEILRNRGEEIVVVDGIGSTWKVHQRIVEAIRPIVNLQAVPSCV